MLWPSCDTKENHYNGIVHVTVCTPSGTWPLEAITKWSDPCPHITVTVNEELPMHPGDANYKPQVMVPMWEATLRKVPKNTKNTLPSFKLCKKYLLLLELVLGSDNYQQGFPIPSCLVGTWKLSGMWGSALWWATALCTEGFLASLAPLTEPQ